LPLLPPRPSTLLPYTTLFRSVEVTGPAPVLIRARAGCGLELTKIATDHERFWRSHTVCGSADEGSSESCRGAILEIAPLLNRPRDRKSTRLNSSHQIISYAVF